MDEIEGGRYIYIYLKMNKKQGCCCKKEHNYTRGVGISNMKIIIPPYNHTH